MLNLVLLFIFLAGGYGFRRSRFAQHAPKISFWLNRWVIRVALPSLVLSHMHSPSQPALWRPEVYLPASQPWIQFLLSLALVTLASRIAGWSRSTWGALVMTVGLGNTSFVGLPLLRAILGPEALPTGIIQDQLGSFLVLSVIGVPFAQMVASQHSGSIWGLLSRPIRFPAFIALVVARLTSGLEYPDWIEAVLSGLAATLSPMSLLSVGMMLSFSALRRREIRHPLMVGVGFKLLVFPAIYFLTYPAIAAAVGGVPTIVLQALLLESAMASQITGGIVAADHGLEPELARLMLGVGIPLSLLTVPLWRMLI